MKRLAAHASLQRPYDQQIMTPKQLYEWAVHNIPSVAFKYSTTNDYSIEEKKLKERFEQSCTIAGTHKLHAFIPLTTNTICTKVYSASALSKIEQVTKLEGELLISDIKGYVIAVYDEKWWLTCVIDTDADDNKVKLSFLHPSGPSPSFKFPNKPDVLLVPVQDVLTIVDPTTVTGRVYSITEKETVEANVKLCAWKP